MPHLISRLDDPHSQHCDRISDRLVYEATHNMLAQLCEMIVDVARVDPETLHDGAQAGFELLARWPQLATCVDEHGEQGPSLLAWWTQHAVDHLRGIGGIGTDSCTLGCCHT